MLYSNYESITLKHPEIEQYLPKIEGYFTELQKNVEEYILQDVYISFYRSYFDNLHQVYNTLNTTGSDIINKYKNIIHNIDDYKGKLDENRSEIVNYLKYIDSLYRNNEKVKDYLNLLIGQRDKVLLYLVNRYGLIDSLEVIVIYVGKGS
jgi:hypothetical protein